MQIPIRDLAAHIGRTVSLHLTLDVLRDQKYVQFLLAHDKSGAPLQLVVDKACRNCHAQISHWLTGTTFRVTGEVIAAVQSKTFGIELRVHAVEEFALAQPFPIGADSSLDLRLTHRVVDLKSPKWLCMLRLRSAFEAACREFALGRDCIEIHTPKLMGNASESGAQVFRVEYFDRLAYLAQSPQFYKQLGIAAGLAGTFEIGPVFRAEDSRSSRHLTEFTGLDIELAWVFETQDVMSFEDEMLRYAFARLEKFAPEVRQHFGVELPLEPSVAYLSLPEAKTLLVKQGMQLGEQDDLSDEGERQLYAMLEKDLIFVYDYPIAKRPFYHAYDCEAGTTRSFDLIFKGIEITTGAIREHRYETVRAQAMDKGVDPETISHYLDNFRYGCPPHGGFGLGIERVITKLLGLNNVKEVSFVPRDPDRLFP
ncbi:aspartate--tRNA(Asn) ligase [Burkholderia sp. Bp9126]|nr:aspartate--tRNA(Asn) ligase [Burkholderia sp. Bp9126]